MFGLIGRKLSHSFSPQIHSFLGDYEYKLFEMEEHEVGDFLAKKDFKGLNVTIPYKKTVIPYLDKISDRAKKIGSVNTIIKLDDGSLFGDNTDYLGFKYMLLKMTDSLKGKKCIILGSGGASLTVQNVIYDMDAKETVVISRSGENNYQNISKHFDANVIINTTPVGMYPNNGISPVNLSDFHNCELVLDLIYNPSKTDLLLQAEKLKIKCANGLSMLAAQGKYAAELFTNNKINDSIIEHITNALSLQMSNVVLIGMPGCGKTTIGKILAQKLNKTFMDTDEYITNITGKTPAEIIQSDGENTFREIEQKAVSDCCKNNACIIATGGGAVLRNENIDAMKQNGKIIFLDRVITMLATDDRPLSSSPEKLKALYEYRYPIYVNSCDIHIKANEKPDKTAQLILAELDSLKG